MLSKFELAKVLGQRAMEIERGDPLYIDPGSVHNAIAIAKMELVSGKLPYAVIRTFPDGSERTVPLS